MLQTNILFVDEHNNGRSILAEAHFNRHQQAARAFSAGFEPDAALSPKLIEVLREEKIAPEDYCPKPIDIFLQPYSPHIDLIVWFDPMGRAFKLPLFANRPPVLTLRVNEAGHADAPAGSRRALRSCYADLQLVLDRALANGHFPGMRAA
nr:hypothetical protein [uncultured Cohaesibacter sp.]